METRLLVCIDGTGCQTYGRTDTGGGGWDPIDFRQSFVKKIYRQAAIPGDRCLYKPGPNLSGSECSGIVKEAIDFVDQKAKAVGKDSKTILNLVGYSRGAYLVMNLARFYMKSEKVTVNFLGLFDAVGRTDFGMGLNSDFIPPNVRVAYHAYSDIKAGSRTFFGHSGMIAESGVQLQSREFWATHAAMGGMPWRGDEPDPIFKKDIPRKLTKALDEQAARDVWEFMCGAVRRHGVMR